MLKHHLVERDVLDLTHLVAGNPGAFADETLSTLDQIVHVPIALTPDATVNGTTADDFIHMAGDGATPPSGTFNEITTVTNGDDTITGGAGNDTIYGDGGNDTIDGGAGNDIIDGGAGFNIATYADATAGVTVDLHLTTAQNTGGAGIDTLTNIQYLIGSPFADTLAGTDINNLLISNGGNDTLTGNGGDDYLRATNGGNVTLDGGDGNDTLVGDQQLMGGKDTLIGGAGNDTMIGNITGADIYTGGAGNDTITGNGTNQDVAVYSGAHTDYTVTLQSGGHYIITDNRPGSPDGMDQVNAVPLFQFSDGTYAAVAFNNPAGSISGTAGNDFIHEVGDGHAPPAGYTEIIGVTEGDDQILASDGNDIVYGDGGDDTIDGGTGTNMLFGGDGNDTFILHGTGDAIDGGAGSDTLSLAGQSSAELVDLQLGLVSGHGTFSFTSLENIVGTGLGDTLNGDDNANMLQAGGGTQAATLTGRGGDDTLIGSDGNDIIDGGAGNDTIDGGTGFNVANYSDATAGVTVDLRITTAQNTGGAGTDTLTNFQYLQGSTFADTLNGSDTDNMLISNSGNDTLNGNGGNDWLRATNGGSVTLNGGAGDDTLSGGDGHDTLIGGAGNDAFTGSNGYDTAVYSGNFADYTITTSITDNRAGSPDGTDTGIGAVSYLQFSDRTVLVSSVIAHDPAVNGTESSDFIHQAGDSRLAPSGYNDIAVNAVTNEENLAGNGGNDIIYGGSGDDIINGGAGDDILHGMSGDDVIDGGGGNDTAVFSGAHTDYTITFAPSTSTYTVIDNRLSDDGLDTITNVANFQFSDGTFAAVSFNPPSVNGTSGNDFIHMAGDGAASPGGGYNEITTVTNSADTINGMDGSDVIYGDGGDDIIAGGAGNDTIDGGAGNDTVDGGTGFNIASYADAAAGVSVDLRISTAQNTVGAGTDTLTNIQYLIGSTFADTLNGNDASNMLISNGGNDTLNGNNGDDWLRATNGGSVTLNGGDGNDTLSGGTGNDTFTGGGGNDTITSGGGTDTAIYTGAHSDYIVLFNSSAGTYSLQDIRSGSPDGTDTVSGVTSFQFSDGTFAATSFNPSLINGTSGNDFIHMAGDHAPSPGGYNEITTVTNGPDAISGLAGDDAIYGGGGDDVISGGDGNDQIDGGGGNDTIDGGTGFNLASYTDAAAGVNVDLRITTVQNTGGAGADTLTNIQYLVGSTFDDTLNGNDASNMLVSNGGNDTLNGNNGDDWLRATNDGNVTLNGGDGNDTLSGNPANDTFTGGAGNDTIIGGGGPFSTAVYGGAHTDYTLTNSGGTFTIVDNRSGSPDGTDTFTGISSLQFSDGTFAPSSFFGSTVNGTTGDDFIHQSGDHAVSPGLGYTDIPQSTNGDDTISGLTGNDLIYAADGNDVINGGDGNDQIDGGAGNDTIDGGTGFNLASYTDAAAGVSIDLRITTAQNTGGAGADTLTNIQYLVGSAFADTLNGNDASNMLVSNGGDDTLNGNNGDDWLRATNGGSVALNGGTGNDTLSGGNGNDTFTGGAGNDTIIGGGGTDTAIYSGNHADYLITFNSSTSTYTLQDARSGSPDGTDTVSGVANFQFADGTVTASSLIPPPGTINGTSGVDFIHEAGDGATPPQVAYTEIATVTENADTINGLDGSDIIHGAGGNDVINGGNNNDLLYGEAGNDTLNGGDGTDELYGGTGSNILNGGDGDDNIHGDGGGSNAIDGGTGTNLLILADTTAGATVSLLAGTAFTPGIAGSTDTIVNIQNILGTTGTDMLTGDNNANTIAGNGGNDTINGLGGDDNLDGGGGSGGGIAFRLNGGDGNDVLQNAGIYDGGAGDDTLHGFNTPGTYRPAMASYDDAPSGVTVDLRITDAQNTVGAGMDTLNGVAGQLQGSHFADTLIGDDTSNGIFGNGGNDTLVGNGGDDWLRSDGGSVSMEGDAGNDYLQGNTGNDTLNGGIGNDTLVGGAGADLFVFHSGDGLDTITDFTHGTDTIEMDGYGISDFATLQSHISQSGSDTVINIDSNDIITLKGVTASTLNSGDFVFH